MEEVKSDSVCIIQHADIVHNFSHVFVQENILNPICFNSL